MDFENARWVKLYCQDTGTWLRLGWQGRTVALHLLRAVSASGVLSDLGTEPELILAELLRLPLEVVTPGLSALVRTGTVTLGGGILVWTAFWMRSVAARAKPSARPSIERSTGKRRFQDKTGHRVPKMGHRVPNLSLIVPRVPTEWDKMSQKRREKREEK